ncbi:epimerase [Skermania piniformis]|uniref:Epimerase n=2 Tax=Skermania pinensis TaxID=39122 RepID=A0ABX8SHT7_9ACTN|nr:epimerase [Skermania piniformis]
MVGQGVLRECLRDDAVTEVLAVGRSRLPQRDPKLTELIHADLADLTPVRDRLAGYDACFFCLGVSSVGMSEPDYRHTTYDLTLAAARPIAELNPGSTFVYVSGAGTDTDGRQMWARVKGETEDAVRALPLQTYLFRPGVIRPLNGIESKTRWYRLGYAAAGPIFAVLQRTSNLVVTTEQLGQAMLEVAQHGSPEVVVDNRRIADLAGRYAAGR